eukprot:6212566-Pleurochrysis_carterae.AAC.2
MASALASAWMRGRATTRSASATPALTASAPPKLDPRLSVVFDQHYAVGSPRHLLPHLHDHVARLEPARHKGQVPGRRRRPALAHVGVDRRRCRRRLLDEARVVKGEDGEQLALRPHLHSALADRCDDVHVLPLQLRRGCAYCCSVDLPGALELRVARGAAHGCASGRVGTVPDHPACPRRHFALLDDDRGHALHVHVPSGGALAQRRHRRVSCREPGLRASGPNRSAMAMSPVGRPPRCALSASAPLASAPSAPSPCRASSTRARTNGASHGQSAMRPPEGGVSPADGAHARVRASASSPSAPHAPSSAYAMATFIAGGYAAASADRARPCTSRP